MRPTSRLLWVLAAWTGLGLFAAFVPRGEVAWSALGALMALLLVVDVLWLWKAPTPWVQRQHPRALALGQWHPVQLRLENPGRGVLRATVFDGYPARAMQLEGMPAEVEVPSAGWAELGYRIRPTERGAVTWGQVELRREGMFGMLTRKVKAGEPTQARIYPDFRQLAKFSLLALDQRVGQMGIHLQRRRGEGLEFFQLREYRQGDSQRQVDWKASSRRVELVSREYRDEQNQQLMLLVDCGRRMHAVDGELSHFDHVLNAALLLSHVALREGDAVGLQTFSGPRRYVAPQKGLRAMTALVNQVFDLTTSTAPSDYAEAASALAARQRRRALVMVLTNLRDDDSQELARAMAPLRRRHLVVIASLREAALDQAAAKGVAGFDDALAVASAHHYLEQRQQAHQGLRRMGFLTLDVVPERLPAALVNSYLDVKRTGKL